MNDHESWEHHFLNLKHSPSMFKCCPCQSALLEEVLQQVDLPFVKIVGFQAHWQTVGVQMPRHECFEVCGQGGLKFCSCGSENLVCKTVLDILATGLAICCCGHVLREQPLCLAVHWFQLFLDVSTKSVWGHFWKRKMLQISLRRLTAILLHFFVLEKDLGR